MRTDNPRMDQAQNNPGSQLSPHLAAIENVVENVCSHHQAAPNVVVEQNPGAHTPGLVDEVMGE